MTAPSTRDRILAIASDLFYREGIRNVGVETICREAGVKKPTLYHHFGSKDGLVAAYLEAQDEAVFMRLTDAAEQASGQAADKVAALFDRVAASAPKRSWKGCPFLRGAAEFASDRKHPARTLAASHKRRFEAWLSDFLDQHGIAEAKPLARQLTVLLDGAVTHAFLHGDGDYARQTGEAARVLIAAASARPRR